MGIWLINADVLAGRRFRTSALAETVATLGCQRSVGRTTRQRP
jgi:hypothetical protein